MNAGDDRRPSLFWQNEILFREKFTLQNGLSKTVVCKLEHFENIVSKERVQVLGAVYTNFLHSYKYHHNSDTVCRIKLTSIIVDIHICM